MSGLPPDRGLDEHGFVRREGSRERVQPAFEEVVEGYVAAVRSGFGADLDSAYLYGSIPRGTARPGVSDLDGQVALTREPTGADRARLDAVQRRLEAAYPQVSAVEILLDSRARLVDPRLRHDEGFHVRVLCTPFWGPDAGVDVQPHRPDLDLARGVQGDWRGALHLLRERADGLAPGDVAGRRALCRSTGRRLTRIAFSWVMPRWEGWTSDPGAMARVVTRYEPGWALPVADAAYLGWSGADDLGLARRLLDGWAQDLTARGEQLGA